ncbi:hypothetical protein ACVWWR_002206 [Bradyrhizobium sp. LM3.2]
MSVQEALPLGGLATAQSGQFRADHLLVAEMVKPGSKVLDVGCGEGDLLQLLETRGIDGDAASSCRARASTAASPRGSRWCRAMPTPTSSIIPTTPSTT